MTFPWKGKGKGGEGKKREGEMEGEMEGEREGRRGWRRGATVTNSELNVMLIMG